ncbi:ABC transporter ATP-binding protein [Thioclava sp.]|uniref:ABC transporter ATP-binding protein n=1 Tax=Thioclava sp. TaxID=1933450 RepID=UPI003AA84BB1
MERLCAHDLYRFYHTGDDEVAALRGVSLVLAPGEIVAVTGPSGSGKSTLLNCLTGLDEPDAVQVTADGELMTRRPEPVRAKLRARAFGILMQSGNLFPHFTVADNIRFQMRMAGRMDEARVDELIGAVGLNHRRDALPAHLSGGETARAGLAVALALDPPILIADEPTAEVDRATEDDLLALFEARRNSDLTTLIATHSEALAHHADRIVRLKDGRVDHD